jgi:starch-binding outer membrane protein, SusD/RagB family
MKYILYSLLILAATACNKQDVWLDVKSNKADVTPVTLPDFQALLDNDGVMNGSYPGLGLIGSDNYFLTTTTWQTGSNLLRNAYVWAPDIFEGASVAEWNSSYRIVEYSNVVLEGIQKLGGTQNQLQLNNARGSALFYRSAAFYTLASLFAAPYDSASATAALGIPLRTTADVNQPSARASVQQTYDRIIADLSEAASLLPPLPAFKTRPSRAAAYGYLSRVYLQVGNYTKALEAANESLALYNILYDFNSLDATLLRPFPVFQNNNQEVIFYAATGGYSFFTGNGPVVDTTLFKSYNANDLRKTIYYRTASGSTYFKGSYTGITSLSLFGGLATNEVYLTRAEAHARLGNLPAALADLNTLLVKRWKTNTFTPVTATSPFNALQLILSERRKELPFTGNIRWEDLRRLNKQQPFAVTLIRSVNNNVYTLPPNHPKYVYPIPDVEIQLSGLQQNPR